MEFDYIDTPELLEKQRKVWKSLPELAIDLECENNMHHYGVYISIIQLSSRDKNWVVDMMAIKDLGALKDVLEDPNILKVFHDVGFDYRILFHQFGCVPKNVVDTKIAAELLGKEQIGLAPLLDSYFDIEKKEKFQKADWTKRPLPFELLKYAVKDTKYLLELKDILVDELKKNKRWKWAKAEFSSLEEQDWEFKIPDYDEAKGWTHLNNKQRALFKRLYQLREELAEKVNRPVHFILNNKRLVECSKKPPRWEQMKGVHPVVRQQSARFYDCVRKAQGESISKTKHVPRFTPDERELFNKLCDIRDNVSNRLHIPKNILLSKDQMYEIISTKTLECLKPWQREAIAINRDVFS